MKRYKSEKHLSFIRQLPCVACKTSQNIQAAHVRIKSFDHGKKESGMAQKPHDFWVVPLCVDCHLNGPEAQHKIGEKQFWSLHRIDPFKIALTLYAYSTIDDFESGICVTMNAGNNINFYEGLRF